MTEFIKHNKASVYWFVGIWMVTVILLLAIGPVIHI